MQVTTVERMTITHPALLTLLPEEAATHLAPVPVAADRTLVHLAVVRASDQPWLAARINDS